MPEEAAQMEPGIQPTPDAQPGYMVLLNLYEPDEWNGGYGHYDLSIIAPGGGSFQCRLGEGSAVCSEITLSYGATDGDLSPARVHLYTGARSDHLPSERLKIYERLSLEAFNAFMVWFTGEFSEYAREADDCHVFKVQEEGYVVYSLAENKNCLSAAIHMALAMPGIRDEQVNSCAALVERLAAGVNIHG